MKKLKITYLLLVLLYSCNNYKQTNYDYQDFDEFGFSIKAPCKLKDVSTSSDFLINYGGVVNENNPRMLEAYQLMVIDLPLHIKKLKADDAQNAINNFLYEKLSSYSNVNVIKFGENEYNGLEAYANSNGVEQKALFFVKDDFIIALVTMSNNNLETKHEKYKNSIKFTSIEKQNGSNQVNESKIVETDKLESHVNAKIASTLTKEISNKYFNLKYPTTWQVVKDDEDVTDRTSIAVQIMQKRIDDYSFCPNMSIIISPIKRRESTSDLVNITIEKNKGYYSTYKVIKKENNVLLGGYKGSLLVQEYTIQGFRLLCYQYIIKKPDNTVFILSATIDAKHEVKQIEIINEILKSIKIF